MQPGGGLNLAGLQQAVSNMAATLTAATSRMQQVIQGQQQTGANISKTITASSMSFSSVVTAAAGPEAGMAAGIVKQVIGKIVDSIRDSFMTAVDTLAAGFQKMKSTVLETVGAFRPFEIEMFNRAIQDLRAVFGTMFLPILQRATTIVRELSNYFFSLPDSFKDTIAGVAKLVLVFGAVAIAVGAIVTAVGILGTILAPVIALGIVLGPLAVTLVPIAGGIAVLTAGLSALVAFNWRGIVQVFEQLWAALESAAQAVWDQLRPVWSELRSVFVELSDQLGDLFDAFKPIIGAGLMIAAVVIKSVLSLIIEGLTMFVRGLTRIAAGVDSIIRSFGLPGFNLPNVARDQQSAFGLGQHGGTVTDPVAAFKSMQEDILKFSSQAEPQKTGIDLVADYTKSMSDNMQFITDFIKQKFSGQNEGESDAHALLRKGPVRFIAGKLF